MPTIRGIALSCLHFAGSVLLTSGVLMILDAGLTLAWQEPVSAVIAAREQSRLDGQLEDAAGLVADDKRAVAGERDPRRRLAALAERHARRVERGDAVGRLELPTLDRSYAIVEGTDTGSLRKAPGHFGDTPLPGQRGTVAVAGHRTTYGAPFRRIDRLKRDDRIVVSMPYGRFTYRVEGKRIVPPTGTWVKRRVRHDRLILSACHPLYSAAKRVIVFARLTEAVPA